MKDIAVLMSIYKEPVDYIEKSILSTIESLIGFDYEFILIIDNPNLSEVVRGYILELANANSRITLVQNEINLGLARSLNIGIGLSNSKYIMRMDADDVCFSSRARSQFEFLEKNASVDIVGASVVRVDNDLGFLGFSKSFTKTTVVAQKKNWKYRSICFHPTWFGRSHVFKSLRYNELKCAQDVEFLYRCIENNFKVDNLPEPLVYYRINSESLSIKKGFEQSLIRLGLNIIYKDGSDFEKLQEFLKKRTLWKRYASWGFNKFHSKYIDFLNSKNYFGLALISCVSLLHGYKLFLLLNSKLRIK